MSHILTDEIKEQLKKIADNLPNIPVKTRDRKGIPHVTRVIGSTLIEQGTTELKDGENKIKIKPNKYYMIPYTKVMINHYRELEKAFIQKGFVGTGDYIIQVKNKAKEHDNEK